MRLPTVIASCAALTLALVWPATGAAAPAASGERADAAACGTVSYGDRTYILYYERLTCRSARRKVRYVHRHKRLPGWRCQSGSRFRTGGSCTRGRKLFGWHPAD